jgi:hypothetical protein
VRPASSPEEPGSRAALLAGEPLLPAVEPDAPLLPDTSAAAEPASGVASARSSESDTAPRAITELVRQIAVEAQLAEPVVAAGAAQPVERAGRRSERARDDAVSGERGHATMPPPAPVVVHIGRIDVRAAEPAPRTVLPPRQPPVQAGRTLADHLLARDRELS